MVQSGDKENRRNTGGTKKRGAQRIGVTREEMIAAGLVENPNMWIGSGWMWCMGCGTYTYHYAMSHKGQSDCFEVCGECNVYYLGRGASPLSRT